jgi:hypothetical protein
MCSTASIAFPHANRREICSMHRGVLLAQQGSSIIERLFQQRPAPALIEEVTIRSVLHNDFLTNTSDSFPTDIISYFRRYVRCSRVAQTH